jgi:hypothetical protein
MGFIDSALESIQLVHFEKPIHASRFLRRSLVGRNCGLELRAFGE